MPLTQRLSQRFRTESPSKDSRPIELVVSTSQWELAYESFLSSSDYSLSYALTVAVIERNADKPQTIKRVQCQGKASEKMPLDAWQAEGYAAVGKVAEGVADQCFEQTMKAFGLAQARSDLGEREPVIDNR